MTMLRATSVLLLICLLFSEQAASDRAVVLVARADSEVDNIDLLDVRKLYLGFSVRTETNQPIRAATNRTSALIYEVFLQDVLAMSASRYDRRLLTLTLQSGRRRPLVIRNPTQLMEALSADPELVSFMWREEAEHSGQLKILRVLWEE